MILWNVCRVTFLLLYLYYYHMNITTNIVWLSQNTFLDLPFFWVVNLKTVGKIRQGVIIQFCFCVLGKGLDYTSLAKMISRHKNVLFDIFENFEAKLGQWVKTQHLKATLNLQACVPKMKSSTVGMLKSLCNDLHLASRAARREWNDLVVNRMPIFPQSF